MDDASPSGAVGKPLGVAAQGADGCTGLLEPLEFHAVKQTSSPAPEGILRRYRAFISYSHKDTRWAEWLHLKLESYKVPKRLRNTPGAHGWIPGRLFPIFRDREELASSGVLGSRLQNALDKSDALLVICSPAAARSHWVNAEIEHFIGSGRGERIYCLIVDGEPNTGDERECFPPALRTGLDVELIAADLRPNRDGRRLALQRLLAGLLGVDLDSLRRRDLQRHHRRMLIAVIASLCGMLLATGLATTAWIARNDAKRRQEQAQDLVVYMLGDLHKKLEKVGRLDLLGSLSDTAIGYLEGLNSRDLNDTTLKQLAQAMSQLAQVRIGQGRYADALVLLHSAYARTKALIRRHPGNGDLLFDRGQVEYWIGYVYYQSQDLAQAQIWWTHYRDTSRAVHAIDPSRMKWELELAYGEHNLAAIEFDRGELDNAAEGFAAAHRVLAEALARSPNDPERIFEMADETSWQANVMEQQGHLHQAEKELAGYARTLAGVVAAHPSEPQWKSDWSNAELLHAKLLRVLGRFSASESVSASVITRMKRLVSQDPANKNWSENYLHALMQRAIARVGQKRYQDAKSDLASAAPLIASLRKLEKQNHLVRRDMLNARQLAVWLAMRDKNLPATRLASAALLAMYQDAKAPNTPEDIGRYGLSQVLAGQSEAALGQPVQARAQFAAARKALEPLARQSSYWRILDPWLRLSLLSGDTVEADRVSALLKSQEYVPVFPWPHPVDGPDATGTVADASIPRHPGNAPRAPARVHGHDRQDTPAHHAASER